MSEEKLKRDVLPDSRLKTIHTPKGMVSSPFGTWIPVFCANCGADGGFCPEENMTFMFYLCNKCWEKYGAIAATLAIPDEVFWEKVRQEQMEKYGRLLTEEELLKVSWADASPLAKLLKARQ